VVEDLHAAGHAAIKVSLMQVPGGPAPFYLKAGFTLTGEMDDGEVVARREIGTTRCRRAPVG